MSLLARRGQKQSPQWEKSMDFRDDPARPFFAGPEADFSNTDFSETEFLRTQVAVIEAYLERFPCDERDFRALAWIEANASQYRQQWQISGRYGQSAASR